MADSYNMSDVFISYSRRDADFVKKLFEDIKGRGKEVWADFEDIPKAADWWSEIQAGIDAADAFVFVISPDSVSSDVCRQEIDHAVASNKRFLPLLYREISTAEDKAKMHAAVSSHNWIYCRESDDYSSAFDTLMSSLETDLEHNRSLTRLLVRAKEWESNKKAPAYLLVGQDLNSAEAWLAEGMSKKPSPTNLHAEYIRASRLAAANRQRLILTWVSVGLVLSLILAVVAAFQTWRANQALEAAEVAREQADLARDEAEFARDDAIASEQYARSLALAATSSDALSNNNPDLSLVLALESYNISTEPPQVYSALTSATYAPSTRLRIDTSNVIKSVVFAPDGSFFAAGFIDGQLCLYSGTEGQQLGCLQTGEGNAHAGEISWVHMSADASRLLSSGEDNRLVFWDISSGNSGSIVSEITVEGLTASALASTGDFAMLGTNTGQMGRWDLSSAEPTYFEEGHLAAVSVIALNRENSLVLSGDEDGEVRLWESESGAVLNFLFNPDNPAPITSVAFSPDSTIGVVGDNNAGITIYNLELGTIARTVQGHNESIRAISFAVSGRSFFTASWDNSIREWDLQTGREINAYRGHNGGINALSLTADNLSMVSGSYDNTLRLWHVRPVIFDRQYLTQDVAVNNADWDERHIVTAHADGTVLVLDRMNGNILQTFPHEAAAAIDLEISPTGEEIFVVYQNCDVAMFNIRGRVVWERSLSRLADEDCTFVHFRPHSEEVLIATEHTLQLLDVRTGNDSQTIAYNHNRQAKFLSAVFTPDGNQLMIGENYFVENLHLLDVETGAIIQEFVGHTDGILSIDLSEDGSLAVSGGFDNDVRVWNVATGESINLLEGHSDRILSVEFSPDNNFVISADNARTIRLWNLGTGFTSYTYRGHTNRVTAASFSPDGSRILTASHDSTVILWKFPQELSELVTWAQENRYIRRLSCSEYLLYVDATISCEGTAD